MLDDIFEVPKDKREMVTLLGLDYFKTGESDTQDFPDQSQKLELSSEQKKLIADAIEKYSGSLDATEPPG